MSNGWEQVHSGTGVEAPGDTCTDSPPTSDSPMRHYATNGSDTTPTTLHYPTTSGLGAAVVTASSSTAAVVTACTPLPSALHATPLLTHSATANAPSVYDKAVGDLFGRK